MGLLDKQPNECPLENYERVIGKMSSKVALEHALIMEEVAQMKRSPLVKDFYLERQKMFERYALLLEKAGK